MKIKTIVNQTRRDFTANEGGPKVVKIDHVLRVLREELPYSRADMNLMKDEEGRS